MYKCYVVLKLSKQLCFKIATYGGGGLSPREAKKTWQRLYNWAVFAASM